MNAKFRMINNVKGNYSPDNFLPRDASDEAKSIALFKLFISMNV